MKQFNNTVILTSKNQEAFLNFTFDSSSYYIIPNASLATGILYVNGLDVNNYVIDEDLGNIYTLQLDATHNIASFHIFTPLNTTFDSNLTFNFYDVDDTSLLTVVDSYDVSVLNRPYIIDENIFNTLNNENVLVNDEASYLVIRTNPKFTGNIKLVVDSSNKLYMDTFKVSDLLSNKIYRKKSVSANSVLSNDIRNNFGTLINTGVLYAVDNEKTLNIQIPKVDLEDQFITTYNYGARILLDELYPEDNGLLAPLWINSKIPDYFAVFRLNGVYNPESYLFDADLSNFATKYFTNANIIKSWSLKYDSNLGKYLNTHLQDLLKISSPVFLSLSDPLDASSESDPNTWYGIAVDKGILTGRSEDPYFFNQKTDNFTELNAFITDGFSRNNLLCPNLINLEFLFSDTDVSDYTMNRYFGVYLTENVLYNVAYYADSSTSNVSTISLDEKDVSIFINSSLFDLSTGQLIDQFKNRLFVLNDGVNLTRITSKNQLDGSISSSYINKPYKNIFSTEVEKLNTVDAFVTLTFNNELEQGEHLRIVNKTQNKIWEFYSINNYLNDCEIYCTISENDNYPTIYHTYFDVSGNIAYQIEQLKNAIERYENYEDIQFTVGNSGNNWISIILNDTADLADEWMIQRIPSTVLNNMYDSSSGFVNKDRLSDITFFGRYTPNESEFEIISYDASFGPIDFEFFGSRQSIMLPFILRNSYNFYSFDGSDNILNAFENVVLYQGTDRWYRKIMSFDISSNQYLYVKDPLSNGNRFFVKTEENINTLNGIFNAYSVYPLTISLMGINPVKDIDYDIYDSNNLNYQSPYSYSREDDVDTYQIHLDPCSNYTLDIPGSYTILSGSGSYHQSGVVNQYASGTIFNTFDSSIYFESNLDTTITYAALDSSYRYSSYSGNFNQENVYSYYDSSIKLKYSLTVPTISKWVGLGNDCRNNPLLFRLDNVYSDVSVNTHFIPTEDSFSQEITYPSFKYLSPGTEAWKGYVFYDINDVDQSTGLTIKELMFEYPTVDYFSKLMYSNYGISGVNTRSSLTYYNGYKNSLDVICTGLSLSFSLQYNAKNLISLKNYDRYRFSILSTASRNRTSKHPIEVIINENTRTILMIWYQGNDELNYTVRHSAFLPGKSLLDPSNNGFVSGIDVSSYYSFVKTPFIINHSTIAKLMIDLYDNDDIFDSSIGSPYAQFNRSLNGSNSIFNAFTNNIIIDNLFFAPYSYNTFSQNVNYTYFTSSNAYNRYTINYGYQYNTNQNLYTNNTTSISTLKYLLSSTSNIMFYLIRNDDVYNSYDFGESNMMSLTLNDTRKFKNVYTYNGWFKPKFNNIFEFSSNEDNEILQIAQKDFTCGNTNIQGYNMLSQLWYNKLTANLSQVNINAGDAISYIPQYSIFKSLWDGGYFIQDDQEINGYRCPVELPSFFGSKLPKFPDKLVFDSWTSSTLSYTENDTEITVYYNLSESIINKFKNTLLFITNWAGLSGEDNIIIEYIKNTIFPYYSVNSPKIQLDLYKKAYSSTRVSGTYDSNYILDTKQNINGQIVYRLNEYYYKILIPKSGNYTYFVKITLNEK